MKSIKGIFDIKDAVYGAAQDSRVRVRHSQSRAAPLCNRPAAEGRSPKHTRCVDLLENSTSVCVLHLQLHSDCTQASLHSSSRLRLIFGNMELDRRLLLAHCAAHALSVIAGLLVVVPLALNGSAFKGRCALFSQGFWRTENLTLGEGESIEVTHLVLQQWGPLAACQFSTFVGVFTVLYGAVQGWRSLFYLHRRHDEWVLTMCQNLNKCH